MPNYPEAEGQQNVVYLVVWTLTGVDGTYSASETGGTGVTYEAGTPYTPYNQLTEEQVLGWVQAAMTPDCLAFYENRIQQSIDNQKNTDIKPLPWGN